MKDNKPKDIDLFMGIGMMKDFDKSLSDYANYNNITHDEIKKVVEDVMINSEPLDSSDDYYRETRYSNGNIKIESRHNGQVLNLIGGSGFTKQYDEAFHEAMKDAFNIGTGITINKIDDNGDIKIENIDPSKFNNK